MQASRFIAELQQLMDEHGDLPIVGGYLHDDSPPRQILALSSDGQEASLSGLPAAEFWITQ